ncbi:AfsR/SARP family transcriptional regulator [Actinomadura violacea]|uniref:AfsR/SARP family transcriptional regulator n=1 Tax=Actinomadura violacea TaxID=2819934 RepID=A0ABS3RLA8_9ACTN|nr:AfsR/SARP family transcriptional regulator [Actinomadura violacea]MBO2457457.1 AfsR/SARP family transcriptional regulator [Actinomadura violacea]
MSPQLAPKPRKILALLLLNANKIVSTSSLMTELWGDRPPKSAVTTLQTYVLHLRKALGRIWGMSLPKIAQDILTTHTNGYMLSAPLGTIDLHVYDELVSTGHRALESGDVKRAVAHFEEALTLWSGPPLADVPAGRLLETEITRLTEDRLSTLEGRISADLRLGRHHQLLGELAALVGQHSFHEGLHEKYMLALYRSGRRHQALDVYQRLRSALVNELGIDPSPRLQQLHRSILASASHLDEVS